MEKINSSLSQLFKTDKASSQGLYSKGNLVRVLHLFYGTLHCKEDLFSLR